MKFIFLIIFNLRKKNYFNLFHTLQIIFKKKRILIFIFSNIYIHIFFIKRKKIILENFKRERFFSIIIFLQKK